ncbi:MAG: DUF3276 family protein [Treponema sp.]|jgi:hypothetical protein|nr:DUF3276 family protein [Treponema sp.]
MESISMGIRGELFSTRVQLPNRTYFFNVKENRMGDLYLNIVESKNRETTGFERQSVVLFADDLKDFLSGFEESLRVMERATHEKRRGAQPRGERRGEQDEQRTSERHMDSSEGYSGRSSDGGAPRGGDFSGGKRVVVKKRTGKPEDGAPKHRKAVRVVRRKD